MAVCVLFAEDIGGILTMEFDEGANLQFITMSDQGDLLYDEIGSVLQRFWESLWSFGMFPQSHSY